MRAPLAGCQLRKNYDERSPGSTGLSIRVTDCHDFIAYPQRIRVSQPQRVQVRRGRLYAQNRQVKDGISASQLKARAFIVVCLRCYSHSDE
jgi:hypothetical protein